MFRPLNTVMAEQRNHLGQYSLIASVFGVIFTFWLGIQFLVTAHQADQVNTIEIATRNLLIALLDSETGQRGYLLTDDPSYLAPFETGQRVLQQRLDELNDTVKDQQESNIADISQLMGKKLTELRETVTLHRDHPDQALAIVKSNTGKQFMDQIRTRIDTLDAWALETHKQIEARATSLARFDFLSLIGTFFIVAVTIALRSRKQ